MIYLVFTEGHMATTGQALVRGDLCDAAIRLARTLTTLLPDEPEVTGPPALWPLADARRAACTSSKGELVLLEDQDRSLWDVSSGIAEGEALLERALRGRAALAPTSCGRPSPPGTSPHRSAAATDWREIAALYGELIR